MAPSCLPEGDGRRRQKRESFVSVGSVYQLCVVFFFQILMSVPSQSRYAPRSTSSVSTLKAAMCAPARVVMRNRKESVSPPYIRVRMSVAFRCSVRLFNLAGAFLLYVCCVI